MYLNKAIFLDRDGVINDFKEYVCTPEDLIIFEEAKEGIKIAAEAGYSIFVVTNQGGIEVGTLTEEELEKIHEKLIKEVEPYGEIREIVYCPFYDRNASCRKPNPTMLLELIEKYNINAKESWMIGDRDTDVEAGIKAGCKTGKIGEFCDKANVNESNLLEVIKKILKHK